MGFLRGITLREALSDSDLFDDIEDGHSEAAARAQREYDMEQVVELFEDDQTITYAQGHPVINFNSFEAKWLKLREQARGKK